MSASMPECIARSKGVRKGGGSRRCNEEAQSRERTAARGGGGVDARQGLLGSP